MKTNLVLKSFRVYQTEDSVRYRIGIDKAIKAIVRDGDAYVEKDVDYIDFAPTALIAQLIQHTPEIGVLYNHYKEQGLRSGSGTTLGVAQLQLILQDATMSVERTKFAVGEEYTTRDGEKLTHDHEGYRTDIAGLKLTTKGEMRLEKMFDKILGL